FKNSDPMTLGRSDTSFIAFGILWFFITLSVESSIIPIKDVIFEHRLYLPSIGFITAFSMVVFHYGSRLPLVTGHALLAVIIIVLSIATYQRNLVWKDKISLWEDVIIKSPLKDRAHNNLGDVYYNKGWIDKAIEHYRIALKIRPDYPDAHYN
ncbi:MAG: tetratricopeptide repeat protein, partial [Nitrospirae bacterium]|nr:tetratricopeptide repeat protein [Nitrospirota bacterium]